MNAEIYLIIRKVFACGYTWDELEKYFADERTASFVEGSSYVRKLDGTPHVLFGDRSGD